MAGVKENQSARPVWLKGSTLAEQLTESDESGGSLTFSAEVDYIEIANLDTANTGTFTVNGVALEVPPEVVVGPIAVSGTASATVSVSGSTDYIVSRYT